MDSHNNQNNNNVNLGYFVSHATILIPNNTYKHTHTHAYIARNTQRLQSKIGANDEREII